MHAFTTRPELRGTFGMVASTHWLASAAGMAVLEQGGNAFDAAVAAGFTLQVVEPHLNGPGGDLPALLWPVGGEPVVLCAQGPAPRAATVATYRELGLELVPGTGPLAAVVPGAFGGWLAMLRDHGTLRLRDVLRFAIGYAEHGYPVLPQVEEAIRTVEDLFRDHWSSSAAVYLPAPVAGSLHRNPALAATYGHLLADAEARSSDRDGQIEAALDIWYRGWIAEAFVAFQQREWLDSSGEAHAGLLAESDLCDWRPAYEQPLSVDYAGLTVLKAGPWSQAPVFLQQLRLLEGFDLAALGHASADYVHTVTECAKLAFADREAWYGDPAYVDVPIEQLLSRTYADERRTLVGDESSPELRPGAPAGREPHLPAPVVAVAAAPGVGEPTRGDTVPPRRRRSLRQRRRRDPERGVAVGCPGDPRARLLPRHAGADVLARGGAAELARAGEAPAHDPVAHPRRARRRALPRPRHARRRPAGSVGTARLPRARPLRDGSPGRDRCAEPPHRGVSRARSTRARWRAS